MLQNFYRIRLLKHINVIDIFPNTELNVIFLNIISLDHIILKILK